MQYLVFFHSNSGYAYTSRHIYSHHIAYFVCNLHHFAQERRALRHRTSRDHASQKSLFPIVPAVQTIDENSAHFFVQDSLSTGVQDLAKKSKT